MIYLISDFTFNTGTRALGAYRLATALRQAGYDVDVIDFSSVWTIQEILNYIDAGPKPLWIGISTTFSAGDISGPQYRTTEGKPVNDFLTKFHDEDYDFLRELSNRSTVVIGGARVTRLKYFYQADYFVTGYADNAVVELSDYLSGKKDNINYVEEVLTSIKDPNVKLHQKIINSQDMYPVNDVLNIRTEYVDNDFIVEDEILPIEISRGCIFKCAFCAFPLNGKQKNDYIRPKEQLIEDITNYQRKYKTTKFLLMDDTFNDTVEKLEMMADIQTKVPMNFNFWAYGRLDLIASNPRMLELLKPSGWKWFSFGIETFKKESGSKIGKGADPDRLKQTLKNIKELYPEAYVIIEMMIGLPNETEEEIMESNQWFKDNPTVWELVNYKSMGVTNPKYNIWNSKMQLTPEKFGMKLKSYNENNYFLGWEHDTMNSSKAVEINDKVYNDLYSMLHTLPSSVPGRIKTSYFIDMSNMPKPWKKGDWQNYTTDFYYNYKSKKLASRGITDCVKKYVGTVIPATPQHYHQNKDKNGTN